jgi:hypothetical protein
VYMVHHYYVKAEQEAHNHINAVTRARVELTYPII